MMRDTNPATGFEAWRTEYRHHRLTYGKLICDDIGKHIQVALFLQLGELYLSMTPVRLKYGAEKAGIPVRDIVDEAIPDLSSKLGNILGNIRSWTPSSLTPVIRHFGPKDRVREL